MSRQIESTEKVELKSVDQNAEKRGMVIVKKVEWKIRVTADGGKENTNSRKESSSHPFNHIIFDS